ncbi:MAG: glycosyltransferase family 39 protein [Candidatus Latescibacteria bacterium]|nr:glycosyltransferase family 39 protein [Candidatus Latescibacterota bacterium]
MFIAIRIFFFVVSDERGDDAATRVLMSRNILEHDIWITAGIWLPLPFYLTAFGLMVFNEPTFTPRFLSLIYSLIFTIPYFYLVKREFSTMAAVLSILIIAFHITHIHYSIISYSDALALLLMFSCVYFFHKSFNKIERQYRHLMIASVMLALLCLTRYEGWILYMPFCLFLFIQRYTTTKDLVKSVSMTFGFGLLPALCIAMWMLLNFIELGDPLYFHNFRSTHMDHSGKWFFESWNLTIQVGRNLAGWFWITTWQLGPLFIILTLAGVVGFIRKQQHLLFMLTPTVIILFIVFLTLKDSLLISSRYTLYYTMFFIPIGIWTLHQMVQKYDPKIQAMMIIIVMFIHLAGNIGIYYYFKSFTEQNPSSVPVWKTGHKDLRYRYVVPDGYKQISFWLKDNLKASEKILIDDGPFASSIVLYGDLDDLTQLNGGTRDFAKNVNNLYQRSQVNSYKPHDYGSTDEAIEDITAYMKVYRPRYMLYYAKASLGAIFGFTDPCKPAIWYDMIFRCKYSESGYHIYEIDYPS